MCVRYTASRRRGLSLSEVMVSLLILTMVMIVALTLLFTMKSFAERQQVRTAPRQTSRRAIDYLSDYISGATDLNDNASPPSPNAIVTWYNQGSGGGAAVAKQATYNNLTDAQSGLGEVGTDIITLAMPTDTFKVPISRWPGWQGASNLYFNYRDGCPDVNLMKRNFLQMTGGNDTNQAQSIILTLVDVNGQWAYYEITGYQQFTCSGTTPDGDPFTVHVTSNPGQSQRINPPGGHPDLVDPYLAGGIKIYSFRVRRDANGVPNLEQKLGLFDPATDNPGTAFTPIMPNVEDLQIAWLYSGSPDGSGRTIFNTVDPTTGNAVLIPSNVSNNTNVPPQVGPGGVATPWDITMVSGIRLSITSRSAPLRFESRNISVRRGTATFANARPTSEDHPGLGPDAFEVPGATAGARVGDFDHQRLTSTILIRNRMLGN